MANVNSSTRSHAPLVRLGTAAVSAFQSVRGRLTETERVGTRLQRGVECYGICFKDYDSKKPGVNATAAARQRLISYRKLAMKQSISFILLALIASYFGQPRVVQPLGDVRFFDCSNDSDTSLVVLRADKGETVELCHMKFFSALGSWLLLFPITLNTISLALYLAQTIGNAWTSASPGMETVPFVTGGDTDDPNDADTGLTVLDRCIYLVCAPFTVVILPIFCIPMVFAYCVHFCLRCRGEENMEINRRSICSTFVVALLIVSCDITLAMVLPFVNYYIIIESTSPSDLIVNMIAVQVFANLDGLIVKEVFTPQETLIENIKPFLTANGPAIDGDAALSRNGTSIVLPERHLTNPNDDRVEDGTIAVTNLTGTTI